MQARTPPRWRFPPVGDDRRVLRRRATPFWPRFATRAPSPVPGGLRSSTPNSRTSGNGGHGSRWRSTTLGGWKKDAKIRNGASPFAKVGPIIEALERASFTGHDRLHRRRRERGGRSATDQSSASRRSGSFLRQMDELGDFVTPAAIEESVAALRASLEWVDGELKGSRPALTSASASEGRIASPLMRRTCTPGLRCPPLRPACVKYCLSPARPPRWPDKIPQDVGSVLQA